MREEIERLRAALVARMKDLRAPITDPRLAALLGQLQILMQQQHATALANGGVSILSTRRVAPALAAYDRPSERSIGELPPRPKELAQGYIRFVGSQGTHVFAPAPPLS